MDVESRLDQALERGGQAVRPDVPAALLDVRRRARRRTAKRRSGMAAAVIGVVLVAGVAAKLGAPGSGERGSPVSPPRETRASDATSLTVANEASAESLGLRKLLSAAVAPNGHVYVTDTSQRVAELGPDLAVIRTWGSSGPGPGQFRLVQGSIAVDDEGRVYVSDTGNFRVQVFTPEGKFVRSIGEFGNGPGQFTWPFDLVVDSRGNIYVADDKEQTLAKLSPSGRQLWRRGGRGETDARLRGHQHLSMLDADGRLLATNDDRGMVLLVGPDGSVEDTLVPTSLGDGGVCDATVAADRYFLTSCYTPSGVQVYRADGSLVGSWSGPGLVQAPRWTADGRGYAVTADGGIVEVRAATG
jgi:DNA-binding beta-propeller fold protein YncE